jgi:hypothetical protein
LEECWRPCVTMGTKLIYLDDEGWSWRGLQPMPSRPTNGTCGGAVWPGRPTSESSSAVHHWAISDLEHHQPGGKGVVSEPNSCPAPAQTQGEPQIPGCLWVHFLVRTLGHVWDLVAYTVTNPGSKILFPVDGFSGAGSKSSPHPGPSPNRPGHRTI